MANIGAVLKSEISRLARKEVKTQTDALRKSNATYRRDVAALERQAADLQRQIAELRRHAADAPKVPRNETKRARFSAKGLKSHRARLGLSAHDYGTLAGVSGQSIYNWESGSAVPRAAQVAALADLRSLGKRQAQAKLEGQR